VASAAGMKRHLQEFLQQQAYRVGREEERKANLAMSELINKMREEPEWGDDVRRAQLDFDARTGSEFRGSGYLEAFVIADAVKDAPSSKWGKWLKAAGYEEIQRGSFSYGRYNPEQSALVTAMLAALSSTKHNYWDDLFKPTKELLAELKKAKSFSEIDAALNDFTLKLR